MKKTIIPIILSVILIISTSLFHISAETHEHITVELDGNAIEFDIEPQTINDRVMVPLRKTFEALGALVKWDDETQTVSARRNSKTVTFVIGSDDMQIDYGDTDENGNPIIEHITLDVPAQIISDRTLVSIRAISEAFGFDVEWIEEKQLVSITSKKDNDDSLENNLCEINLSDLSVIGEGAQVNGKRVLITKGGDYTVYGTLSDGGITVNTDEKVKIRLKNASITSSDDSCIYFEKADKAYITISDGTENTLISQNAKGTVYSKENLEIKGKGTLNIEALSEHGIKASDNLTIENGIINITALGDGIHINDTFKMTGGELNISSVGDGIDSESIVLIEGGNTNIKTNGVPIKATENTNNSENLPNAMRRFGGPNEMPDVEFESSTKGIKAEWILCVRGGSIAVNSADHAIHCTDAIEILDGKFLLSSEYGKGISGHGNVLIDGENTVVDITKSTEGLESKNILTVNNGIINIISSDDGINATGGTSGEMMMPPHDMNGMPPQEFDRKQMPDFNAFENGGAPPPPDSREDMHENRDMFKEGEPPREFDRDIEGGRRGGMRENMKNCLIINGGAFTIKAGDDCIDSNGSMTINGGIIKAVKTNGTLTGNNSILDSEGQISINSGVTLILAGSGGTLDIPQNCITVYQKTSCRDGDEIILCDTDGNVIESYTPNGDFGAVFITTPDLMLGETYALKIGADTYDITLSEQNTVIGTPKYQGGRIFGR